jgi:DNA-binding transcriptional MocR family regulator
MLEVEQYHDDRRGGSASRPHAGITGSTAREIATSAEAAIREGVLDTGDTLPTVRALATALGTSPATVNAAYRTLRQRGLVIAEGRRGTRVAPRPALRVPERSGPGPAPPHRRDLAIGLPDPELLPAIEPALRRIDLEQALRIEGLETADPRLAEVGRAWFEADGLAADALAVVSGAFDGVERVLQAHLRPGDRVIVEDPAYIAIRDLLLGLGLVVVPVPVDEFGFVPERFEDSLSKGAEAIIVVPRAQNPLGAAMDAERMATLQRML